MQLGVWRDQPVPTSDGPFGPIDGLWVGRVEDLEDEEHEELVFIAYLEGRACYVTHKPL